MEDNIDPINSLATFFKDCTLKLTTVSNGYTADETNSKFKPGDTISKYTDVSIARDKDHWQYAPGNDKARLAVLLARDAITQQVFIDKNQLAKLLTEIVLGLFLPAVRMTMPLASYFEILEVITREEISTASPNTPPFRDAKNGRPITELIQKDPKQAEYTQKVYEFIAGLLSKADAQLKSKDASLEEIVKQYYREIIKFLNQLKCEDITESLVLLCHELSNTVSDNALNAKQSNSQMNTATINFYITNIILLRYINPIIMNYASTLPEDSNEQKFVREMSKFIQLIPKAFKPENSSPEGLVIRRTDKSVAHTIQATEITSLYSLIDFIMNKVQSENIKFNLKQTDTTQPLPLSTFEQHQLKAIYKSLNIDYQQEQILDETTVATVVSYLLEEPIPFLAAARNTFGRRKSTVGGGADLLKQKPEDLKKLAWPEQAYLLKELCYILPPIDLLNVLFRIYTQTNHIIASICYLVKPEIIDQLILTLIDSTHCTSEDFKKENNSMLYQFLLHRTYQDNATQRFLEEKLGKELTSQSIEDIHAEEIPESICRIAAAIYSKFNNSLEHVATFFIHAIVLPYLHRHTKNPNVELISDLKSNYCNATFLENGEARYQNFKNLLTSICQRDLSSQSSATQTTSTDSELSQWLSHPTDSEDLKKIATDLSKKSPDENSITATAASAKQQRKLERKESQKQLSESGNDGKKSNRKRNSIWIKSKEEKKEEPKDDKSRRASLPTSHSAPTVTQTSSTLDPSQVTSLQNQIRAIGRLNPTTQQSEIDTKITELASGIVALNTKYSQHSDDLKTSLYETINLFSDLNLKAHLILQLKGQLSAQAINFSEPEKKLHHSYSAPSPSPSNSQPTFVPRRQVRRSPTTPSGLGTSSTHFKQPPKLPIDGPPTLTHTPPTKET